MRKFLIVLVVSVLILGAGAGVAEWYVRGKVVDQIVAQVEDATGSTPDVTLESFPVLLDLARGSLTSVAGSAGELAFEDLSLTDVDVHAAGVATGSAQSIDALTGTASGATIGALTLDDVALAADTVGFEPLAVNELEISAQALTAGGVVFDDVTLVAENVAVDPEFTADLVLTGRLSIEEVEALVRAQLGDDAAVTFVDEFVVLGREVFGQELSIAMTPDAVDGGLLLTPASVSLGGMELALEDLPFGIGEQIQPIPVELPLGPLRLDAVEIDTTGVHAELSGENVSAADFASQ